MKLKFMLLSLLGAIALPISAQTKSQDNVPAPKLSFDQSVNSGWFISLQGGAAIMEGRHNSDANFKDRVFALPALSVGKFHNPYFASRLQIVGGQAYTFGPTMNVPEYKQTNKFVGAHYDFMFDLVNYFTTYKSDRLFHFTPFVGLGYEYKFDSKFTNKDAFADSHSLTAHGGLQLAATVSKRIDILAECMATYNNFPFNKDYNSEHFNGLRLSATAGIRVKLGNTDFPTITAMDMGLVNNLNNDINALRVANAELAKRPESCPDYDMALMSGSGDKKEAVLLTDKVILFRHAKSNVSEDQLIHLFEAAKVVENGGKLTVTAYVDKKEKRINSLAEKRAKAVLDILTNKYGVSQENISIEWKEAGDAIYNNGSAWNRVVVISSK